MARKPRFSIPGVPQHIVQRGHNRDPCYYSEFDYICYLDILQEAAEKNNVAIHAYVLMTNHSHIMATPANEFGITHMIQDLGRKYVRYINKKYQRTGSLWEGRYKACLVDSEAYLLTCMRYIEMNPVRAGMVTHPSEYRWSSYAVNAKDSSEAIIKPHPLYMGLGKSDDERKAVYRDFFCAELIDGDLEAIRTALSQELVVGREDFKDKIEKMLLRQTRQGVAGRPRVEEERVVYYLG